MGLSYHGGGGQGECEPRIEFFCENLKKNGGGGGRAGGGGAGWM